MRLNIYKLTLFKNLDLLSQLNAEIQLLITQCNLTEINRNEYMLNYGRSTNILFI